MDNGAGELRDAQQSQPLMLCVAELSRRNAAHSFRGCVYGQANHYHRRTGLPSNDRRRRQRCACAQSRCRCATGCYEKFSGKPQPYRNHGSAIATNCNRKVRCSYGQRIYPHCNWPRLRRRRHIFRGQEFTTAQLCWRIAIGKSFSKNMKNE